MKQSLRKAINEMCKYCIYSPDEKGSWVEQVTNCTDHLCPLFLVRPLSRGSRVDIKSVIKHEREAAVRGEG